MADDPTATFKQDGKLLKIRTALDASEGTVDGDPLLLIKLDGREGISVPFTYDLVLYRSAAKPDIQPKSLLNTEATIFVRSYGEGESSEYVSRRGVIAAFEKQDADQNVYIDEQDRFIRYTARLVPALKMMEYEIRFRVFENLTVIDILKQVLFGFPNLAFDKVDFSLLEQEQGTDPDAFPRLPYCTQFNESSLNFVSRLMAEYGIWYYFGRPGKSGGGTGDADNDTLILGRRMPQFYPTVPPSSVQVWPPGVVLTQDPPTFEPDTQNGRTIAGFRKSFKPTVRQVRVGAFNSLKPAEPITGGATVQPSYDLAAGEIPAPGEHFRQEIFPTPIFSEERSASTGENRRYQDAREFATIRMQDREAEVFGVAGVSRDPTFQAGRVFKIEVDLTNRGEAGRSYLITSVQISALETHYKHLNAEVVARTFFRSLGSQFQVDDATLTTVSQGLTEISQNFVEYKNTPHDPHDPYDKPPPFWPYFGAGTLASIIGVLPAVWKNIVAAFDSGRAEFANNFTALSVGEPPNSQLMLPLPQGVKPVAAGPHLAIVVGPNGSTSDQQQLHADTFGRVRVRFPWDPTGYQFTDETPSAWVRVTQNWAGQQFGVQFLPRIGDEVLVAFLDGDPDRPIITGQVYNAADGPPNLPFPSPGSEGVSITRDDLVKPKPGHFSRSGVKTRSVRPAGGAPILDRFHMLRFEDDRDQEQTLLRSQGRLDVTSFASTFITSHGDRHVRVGGKDEKTGRTSGSLATTVGGEEDRHVGKSRYVAIDENDELSVKGHIFIEAQDFLKLFSTPGIGLSAQLIELEASRKISLKVGSSFVVIDPAGVFITGPMVQINSGGSAMTVEDSEMTEPLDAAGADPGKPPNWLAQQKVAAGKAGSPGGGRRRHTAHASHGLNVTCNSDGTYQVTPGVRIKGDPAYVDQVMSDLATINDTEDGRARLGRIDGSGHQVTIQNFGPPVIRTADANAFTLPGNGSPADWANATASGTSAGTDAAGHPQTGNGSGSDANIYYDPKDWPSPRQTKPTGSDASLNHELGHADNFTHGNGQRFTPNGTDRYGNQEEFNNLPNDNAYRRERGYAERNDYGDF